MNYFAVKNVFFSFFFFRCWRRLTVEFKMSSEVKISKLKEQKDWTLWKLQTKVVLKSLELFKVVDGTDKYPVIGKDEPTTTELAAYQKQIDDWAKKDVKAQSVILTSIDSQPLLHIVSCKTSQQMWEKLHSVFEQKSQSGVYFLLQKFFRFEKSDEEGMANFISKLEEIVQQLDDLGEKISEKMVVTRILMALPSTFNHFHSAWESTADEKKTLVELRNRLMIEERRMSVQTEQNETGAFVANRFGKRKSTQPSQYERSNKSRMRKCYTCGSTSHLKKDCTSKQNTEALCCDALLAVGDADDWFLDSGATEHMSKNLNAFYEYSELSEPHPVKIGNGSIMYGKGVGKIDVLVFDGQKWHEKHLADVLYVPNLHVNLFSQGRCLDKGYILTSNSTECVFKDGARVVAKGIRKTGLYRMLIKTKQRESVSSANIAVKSESIPSLA